MRTIVFRILAGLLAIGSCFVIFDRARELPLHLFAAYCAITMLFGVFAILGPAAADRVLGLFIADSAKRKEPTKGEQDS